MVSATTIRGCTTCLVRRRPKIGQTISISNLSRDPNKVHLPAPKVRNRSRADNFATSSYNSSRSSTLKHQNTKAFSKQRRKASMAGESLKRTSEAADRSYRKDLIDHLSEFLGRPRTFPISRWVTPKHYSITFSEMCGHGSFILVAISYAVDDFLWLRIIAVAGSTSMLFFTYFHPHGRVLWLPFKWNCLFIAINSYRIGKVYFDRYMAEQLSEELMQTRSKHFYLMDPVDFAQLARLGRMETFKKGERIVLQGESNSHVRFVVSGSLTVLRDETLTYLLSDGNFVSESGLHAGLMLPDSVDSCCTIEARSDVRLLSWDRTELCDLLERSEGVKRAVKAILSWDIVRKLKAQRTLLSEHIIEDPEEWTRKRREQTDYRYASILKTLLATHDKDEMRKRKRELKKYRTIHHIDDQHHKLALEACGWTLEEFEEGCKKDQRIKRRHGPEWYVRELIHRIVG